MNERTSTSPRQPLQPPPAKRRTPGWLWVSIALLLLLHHDFWYWNDPRLVFGFLPIGMAYHVGYSIAAALLWLSALLFAWPEELEEWATGRPTGGKPGPPR